MFGSFYFGQPQFGDTEKQAAPTGIAPSGIPSISSFGTPSLTFGAISLTTTGIASSTAFGAALVEVSMSTPIVAPGIATESAFGTPTLSFGPVAVTAAGISSAEVFGGLRVRAFDGSYTPVDMESSGVWVGYDEANDTTVFTTAGSTPSAVWVDTQIPTSDLAPRTVEADGAWVVN